MRKILLFILLLTNVCYAQNVVKITNKSQHPYKHTPNDLNVTNSPVDDYALKYDSASGNFKWGAATGGSGTPGGSPTQLQYNDGGSFSGVNGSGVDSNGNIGIGSTAPNNPLVVNGKACIGSCANRAAPANGLYVSGNIGVGTWITTSVLDVQGTTETTGFQLTTNPSAGYVLTSTSTGVGTWMPAPTGGGSGTVTNIETTGPITGGPITTTGTIGIDTTGTWNGNAVTATTASTVTTNANLTGPVTSVGNATTIGSLAVQTSNINWSSLNGNINKEGVNWTSFPASGFMVFNGSSSPAADTNVYLPKATVTSGNFCKGTGTTASCTDSSTYLTGNQTVTLSGPVTGSGSTAITTSITSNSIQNTGINWSSVGGNLNKEGINWTSFPASGFMKFNGQSSPTADTSTYLTAVTADSPLSGSGTSASHLVFTNPGYITSVGIGTANTISYWDSTSTIGSLNTSTYPNLTELSYVKGASSALQTQINGKQANLSLVAGTYQDGKYCTYTSSGTVLNCNSTPTASATPGGGVNAVQYNANGVMGGVENIFSFNATNVGINTTNGKASLEIVKSGTNPLLFLSSSAGDTGSFIRVNADGNVGLATFTPGKMLDISGDIRLSSSSGDVVLGTDNKTYISYTAATSNDMQFFTNSLERLRITNSGSLTTQPSGASNIGIGTLVPKANIGLDSFVDVTGSGLSGVALHKIGSPKEFTIQAGTGNFINMTGESTASNNKLTIRTTPIANDPAGSGLTTVMVIEQPGNLGVGTATTSSMLNVLGGASFGSYVGTAAPAGGALFSGNIGVGTALLTNSAVSVMNGNIGVGTWNPAQMLDVKGGAVFGSSYSGSIQSRNIPLNSVAIQGNLGVGTVFLERSGLSVMNGNVGIGTFAPFGPLHVGVGTFVTGKNNVFVVDGFGNIGMGTILQQAGLAVMNGNVGIGTWVVDSGRTVIAGGNLGIGTVRPGQALDVTGAMRFSTSLIGIGTLNVGVGTLSANNAACNTTCTSGACLFGYASGQGPVDCQDATADRCVCFGRVQN